RIVSFAGLPLIYRGEVLGVLAFFSREEMSEQDAASLRAFADHAALAIGNARRFEESEWLRKRAELESGRLRSGGKKAEEVAESAVFTKLEQEPVSETVSAEESEAEESEADYISEDEWKQLWRDNISAALKRSGGKLYGPGGAAELLGVKPTTLASQMKALGI